MRAKKWKYKRCLVSMLLAIEPTFLCLILQDIYTDTTNSIGTQQLLSRTVQQTVSILIKKSRDITKTSLSLLHCCACPKRLNFYCLGVNCDVYFR